MINKDFSGWNLNICVLQDYFNDITHDTELTVSNIDKTIN